MTITITIAMLLKPGSGPPPRLRVVEKELSTANLRGNITDFRGFDSSIILILRGGIPRPIGDFQESLSQAILVGTILTGRLGVASAASSITP